MKFTILFFYPVINICIKLLPHQKPKIETKIIISDSKIMKTLHSMALCLGGYQSKA